MLLHVDGMYNSMEEFRQARGDHGGDNHGGDDSICGDYEVLWNNSNFYDVLYNWFRNNEFDPDCITQDYIKWVFESHPGDTCFDLRDWMVDNLVFTGLNFHTLGDDVEANRHWMSQEV